MFSSDKCIFLQKCSLVSVHMSPDKVNMLCKTEICCIYKRRFKTGLPLPSEAVYHNSVGRKMKSAPVFVFGAVAAGPAVDNCSQYDSAVRGVVELCRRRRRLMNRRPIHLASPAIAATARTACLMAFLLFLENDGAV